jgi:hypothetical protein
MASSAKPVPTIEDRLTKLEGDFADLKADHDQLKRSTGHNVDEPAPKSKKKNGKAAEQQASETAADQNKSDGWGDGK